LMFIQLWEKLNLRNLTSKSQLWSLIL